uniref:Uncharacterized protein n=1 Tax=Coccidioides posadasii RMSCC 3488 TaxID=454284 RepID=A0A0J6F4E4_COCPO|nr:hypothetical protein CPAG_00477 [Coccidioides posadasii RMSCC 3488]
MIDCTTLLRRNRRLKTVPGPKPLVSDAHYFQGTGSIGEGPLDNAASNVVDTQSTLSRGYIRTGLLCAAAAFDATRQKSFTRTLSSQGFIYVSTLRISRHVLIRQMTGWRTPGPEHPPHARQALFSAT